MKAAEGEVNWGWLSAAQELHIALWLAQASRFRINVNLIIIITPIFQAPDMW